MSKDRSDHSSLSATLLVVFSPILVIGAVTTLAAILVGLFGWYRDEMLATAAVAGAITATLTLGLIYRRAVEGREANRAMQHAEAVVGRLLESAMDAIVTVDEQQRVVQFNPAAEKVFRWPRAAVIGEPLEKLIPARFHHVHRADVERFGATGVTSRRMGDRTVVTGLRSNGEEFPVEASISQLTDDDGHKLYSVILRDVTERVKAEQMLGSNEARLRGILDSAMDAIITVDDSQHIVLFNAAAEAVFGCPREEAIGAPLAWFIPERYRERHVEHIRRFGMTGETSRRMGAAQIVMGLRRNGEEFPIEASISQISEGESKFYTVILRDVTERLRADQALRRSQAELREFAAAAQSVREQEKSRIARELHDELAQSLTALKMDTTWLTEKLATADPAVKDKLSKMLNLLDSTVTSTRRISADLRPLMLDDLGMLPAVQWLAQNFMERSGVACDLEVDLAEDLPEPYATAVFRMLQESLTNVARHAQASLVEVFVSRADGAIRLSVRDNGRGFVPDNPRKPGSHGLLGLRERVYLLNGELQVDSAPGRGTRIDIRIPFVAAEITQ